MSENKSEELILALNTGSSSLKISVYFPNGNEGENKTNSEPVSLLLSASFENISAPPALFTAYSESPTIKFDKVKKKEVPDASDHETCLKYFIDFIEANTRFDKSHITQVCHRVVHGGRYPGPVLISPESLNTIERLSDLAPLHNGAALSVIEACLQVLPNSKSVAFFDSSFHSTMPDCISKYVIDPEIADQKGLRKYGFHGLSYSYILREVSKFLKKPREQTTLIVMHLGSGASVCAIKDGKSFDTSMGLTPVAGLPGATRSGDIDPSLIFHYTNDASRISHGSTKHMHITEAEEILNKHSGWKALVGTTNFAEIASRGYGPESTKPENAQHKLAFDIFIDRIVNFVASYFVKLGGAEAVDALVFAGGIGERSPQLRAAVGERCKCLGFVVDEGKNGSVDRAAGSVAEVGSAHAKTLVCWTDEQIEMARDCVINPDLHFVRNDVFASQPLEYAN